MMPPFVDVSRQPEPDRFQAGLATAWLVENTPQDWCWTMGYHPFHGACRGRGPGERRITLTLLLPQEPAAANASPMAYPRFMEEMTVKDASASYLVLAERAAARARAYVEGRGQEIPRDQYREAMAAESAAAALLKEARGAGGWAPVYAKDLHAASMLVKLGLATAQDDGEGPSIYLTPQGLGGVR